MRHTSEWLGWENEIRDEVQLYVAEYGGPPSCCLVNNLWFGDLCRHAEVSRLFSSLSGSRGYHLMGFSMDIYPWEQDELIVMR